jgi:hypothetical protein
MKLVLIQLIDAHWSVREKKLEADECIWRLVQHRPRLNVTYGSSMQILL